MYRFHPRAALAAALLCALLPLVPAPAAAQARELLFPGRAGLVRFDHAGHAARSACRTCHHAPGEPAACGSCHTGVTTLPKRQDALHKVCTACHRERGLLTRCRDCHAPPDGRSR